MDWWEILGLAIAMLLVLEGLLPLFAPGLWRQLFAQLLMRPQDIVAELMRQEHEGHGAELRRLAELTNNITAPRDACTTWRALYQGLRAFRDDLMAHIHTENNILFERFAPAQVH